MGACRIPEGALTALVTPFTENGEVDWQSFCKLIRFQISQGIFGIVPAGTTGESPTFAENEHCKVNSYAIDMSCGLFVLAGCGSNCTNEAMRYVRSAAGNGCKAVLLVDPYYNGPSSLELKKEYYGPIARAFPEIAIVPYIIPGRTGCKLLPEDLAALNKEFSNICAVKEATGDLQNMVKTRSLTSQRFQIFSGDDDKTYEMMLTPAIDACGVISVISNIAPLAVQMMCQAINKGNIAEADRIKNQLDPLFKIVTVLAERMTSTGTITDKFRNPLPIKTAMNGLGMPAGPCRQPLGKMSQGGAQKVREALKTVWTNSPEVLQPIEGFFSVSIDKQLANDDLWEKLSY